MVRARRVSDTRAPPLGPERDCGRRCRVTASTSIATSHELAVDKATGTHADVFAVAGLADLLASTLGDTRVHVRDDGQRFVVTLDEPLTDRDLGGLAVQPGYPYLRARRK